MGFNKRYVSMDLMKSFVKNGYKVSKIFDSDMLIFEDDKSHKIYKLFRKGEKNKKLKKLILNGK